MFETTKVVRVADVAVGCRLLLGIRVGDHPHDADDDADEDANNDAASISSRSLPKNDSRDDALTLAVAAMGAMMMMDAAADTTAGILFGYSKQ